MIKRLKIASKTLSIQYPRWFFEALHLAQSKPSSLELVMGKNTKITPSGIALLTLLEQELKTLGGMLQYNHPSRSNPITLPYHDSLFSIEWFEQALKPLFFENFLAKHGNKISEDRAFDLQLLFSELTQNAKDHSGSERYLVYLSPNEIGVFDLGVSIPAKLEQKYSFENDIEAIEFSLKEGTSTRRLRTGGFGLFYTLDLIKKNDGELFMASRHGQIRRYFKNKKIDRKHLDPKMPGTLIYCRLGQKKD